MAILKANASNCLTCAYINIIRDEELSSTEMENKYPGMTLYKNGAAYQCTNNMISIDDDELRLGIAYAFSGRKISCKMYSRKINA